MITIGENTKVDAPVERVGKRVQRSKQERRRIVEETLQPGVSVAVIARQHGVNANQVFYWRKLYREGLLETDGNAALLPVRISAAAVSTAQRVAQEPTSKRSISGTIHIEIGEVRIRMEGSPDPACVRAVVESLRR